MTLSFDRSIAFAVGILLLNFIAWRFFRIQNGKPRLAVRSALLLILSVGLWAIGANPMNPAPWPENAPRHFLYQMLELLWWVQAAEVAATVLVVVVLPATLRRERLLQDVLRAAVYLAACVLAVAYVLAVPIGGLIATSGALAIIIGLAVQSTLSDVFSGIVLNGTQPFRIGDLVTIGTIQGEVVDSDWRATTLLNANGNYVVVPNSVAAKEAIVNESRPALVHGVSVSVRVATNVRPAVILSALNDAIEGTSGLLDHPPPAANAKRIARLFMEYEVSAYVASAAMKAQARNELIDQIYRHLVVRGVTVGHGESESDGLSTEHLLRSVPIFQTLGNEQLGDLTKTLTYMHFRAGEVIYDVSTTCPDENRALYIVASGVVAFLVEREGLDVERRRLVPGDTVGQSGVLTGVSVPIKLKAVGKVVMVMLPKDALTPILHDYPEVGRAMLEALLDHQARATEAESEIPAGTADQGKSLIQRLLDGMHRMHRMH